MDINKLYNIDCLNEEELDNIKLEELKNISQEYGLNQHGTKITLCKNVQSYLKAIETPTSQNLDKNNILFIHNIYDFIRVLNINDFKDLHTLSKDDIEFLWNTLENEIEDNNLNSDLLKVKDKYHSVDEIDLKTIIIIDLLSKLYCDCILSKKKYGKKKVGICKKTVLNRYDINTSNYICDNNNNLLLPKFGDRIILNKYSK